ncbi:AraC family transcriptional regulator [Enterococcus mediterraneensis]|uniref:AraC family transcriptional regulator n=1 Tax=Enterococcus mediterraneensis TaxID=2364791 RepID=UPI000F052B35|nr:AraC family transcriptional regulator [Enterococcus mediterraneensis]
MDFEELKELFFKETEIERIQRLEGININDQHLPFNKVLVPKMPSKNFFKEGNIFINKHHRYSAMPAHTHEFVEFNYMLSGQCTQYINDEKITLKQGELLLIDKDIVQRIDPIGYEDILINILLKDDSITTELLTNMVKANSLVNEFILNASKKNSEHNAFIHFQCGGVAEVQSLLERILIEYFKKEKFYERALNLMLSLLLIELTRHLEEENLEDFRASDAQLLHILQYIDINFTTLTLADLSKHFGYNPNYISNKLKQSFGYSFQEIVNQKRYEYACELIRESDKSLEEISFEIGFQSVPSLYKLFAKFTKETPKEYRKRADA